MTMPAESESAFKKRMTQFLNGAAQEMLAPAMITRRFLLTLLDKIDDPVEKTLVEEAASTLGKALDSWEAEAKRAADTVYAIGTAYTHALAGLPEPYREAVQAGLEQGMRQIAAQQGVMAASARQGLAKTAIRQGGGLILPG